MTLDIHDISDFILKYKKVLFVRLNKMINYLNFIFIIIK